MGAVDFPIRPQRQINRQREIKLQPELPQNKKLQKSKKQILPSRRKPTIKSSAKKGAKEADLKKYANKNIQVTGRVSLLSLEKKDAVQPWVTLYAPGVLKGVSCYFDDDNLEQMKRLKMDKIVTVQGFQNDFIVPEVSPRLEHCIVIKAD
ncbi:MAG: hypothetical protein HC846_01975 [Blastocatellia bacterium]|nr:hypothetical protein [Blastocatellia bacterium]